MAGTYRRISEDGKWIEEVQFLRDSQGKINQIRITVHSFPVTCEQPTKFKTVISRGDREFEEALQREKRILKNQINTLNAHLKMLERKEGEERLAYTAKLLRTV